MEFRPRYPQPFTLAEATLFDVAVITEEISRLQNSLQRLKETQDHLREYVEKEAPADVDPEITKALEENEDVIGSQEERVLILKLALSEKGIHMGSHYDLGPKTDTSSVSAHPTTRANGITSPHEHASNHDDGGIDL
ncbi:hypothetical protein Hypma_010086 [Hypsizygus marmoreus]|uniref:Uncharacterized protein n=1 Tax=Hypsizygus marmoreus TaxID=39966 RepID=A0A369JNL3_HYPMA|nr:hypothetical protein Hypma_010086 [Hypsizygus marmoreus]